MFVECEYCGHRWDSDAVPVRGRVSCAGCGNNTRVDEAVRLWLGRVANWKRMFRVVNRFWCEVLAKHHVFGELLFSEIVKWQENAKNRDRYVILGLAQTWINAMPLRYKSKVVMLSYVRSIFLHNHVELPHDRSFRFHADVPAVEGKLNKDDFVKILMNSNKMYRAVFLMMAHGLMGCGEIVYVNRHHWETVLENVTKNVGVFKIALPGRKRSRNKQNFFTMLSTKSDWASAMRDYLKSLPELPSQALFYNQKGKPLQAHNIGYYFHKRAVEAGVIRQFTPDCSRCGSQTVRVIQANKIGYKCKECLNMDWASDYDSQFTNVRYGVNPHEIRDLMRSRWRASGAKVVVAEFMMEHGEQVDPNEYDKMKYTPGYAEKEYLRALTWLNVLSVDPEKVSRFEVDGRLQESRAEVDALSRRVVDLERKQARYDEVLTDPNVVAYLEGLARKRK